MQILALITDAYGGHGGISRFNRDLLGALDATDLVSRVTVLPRRVDGPVEGVPGKVVQLPVIRTPLLYSLHALQLAHSMPARSAIFCGHIRMAPLAEAIARLTGSKVWLQLHGIEAWAIPRPMVRYAAEQASLVTAVSRYTRQRMLAAWWTKDPARVRVLPNTVSPVYVPGPRSAHVLARHGLAGRKVILTVSRLGVTEREKGHDCVIAALPRIAASIPDVAYLMVGRADDRARLERVAQRFGVADRVSFAGEVADGELADYYRAADVFAMPSTKEGFGIVFLEAAACGLPVVAGNRDGSVDALAEGALGALIDPENIDEISAAVVAGIRGGRRDNAAIVARFSQASFRGNVARLVKDLDSIVQAHRAPGRSSPLRAWGLESVK